MQETIKKQSPLRNIDEFFGYWFQVIIQKYYIKQHPKWILSKTTLEFTCSKFFAVAAQRQPLLLVASNSLLNLSTCIDGKKPTLYILIKHYHHKQMSPLQNKMWANSKQTNRRPTELLETIIIYPILPLNPLKFSIFHHVSTQTSSTCVGSELTPRTGIEPSKK